MSGTRFAGNAPAFTTAHGMCDMKELIELFAEKVGRYPRGNVQDELRAWLANEIITLRQKLEQAEQENERVRQANLDVMMHFEDMKAAKEKAEALVARMNGGPRQPAKFEAPIPPRIVEWMDLDRPQPPQEGE